MQEQPPPPLDHPSQSPAPTAAAAAAPPHADWAGWAKDLIAGRQNFTPRRLLEPGPSAAQLEQLLEAAAAAPDHGELTPWRFVIIPERSRARLGDVFKAALLERDSSATPQQQEEAREKAHRAPCLLLAIVDLSAREKPIPAFERVVSVGCAIQNMLLLSRAMGFGSGLSSGKALGSVALRNAFSLAADEHAICFVSFGTVGKARSIRSRPGAAQISSEFAPSPLDAPLDGEAPQGRERR